MLQPMRMMANSSTVSWRDVCDDGIADETCWHISTMTNPSVPEGVLCIVPSGSDLTDQRVRVQALSPAALPAAKRFAFLLAALRDGRSDFIFPIPNEETL
tara:strand:- start:147895 stop:148194 length:300 start_codon:yes stop_codon:yes gene_type:complete